MGLALQPQEVQTESNNPVTQEVKYLLKESAIRLLSEVKVPSIEMFGDAAFLSPGKTFFYRSPGSFVIVPTLINKAPLPFFIAFDTLFLWQR